MKKLNGTVIVTYRCSARCNMCNRYKNLLFRGKNSLWRQLKSFPYVFYQYYRRRVRTDLKDIVRELYKKSDRIVISTNGFFTDRIIDLCKEFPQIGIRISIEELEEHLTPSSLTLMEM